MTAEIPELKTRKPSGRLPWPLLLLAGVEKSGKSYASAAFSGSTLIDRTFYVEIGEGAADQYGEIPGARYEIVEHDGTYTGIGRALKAATMQPRPNGRPHAIVVDSVTELWDLLSEEAQQAANKRKGKGPDGEAQITMDLWNVAKKRWRAIVDLLRTYDGPVILTARLEQVAVVENGKPTEAREWKVRAEKNLPFECDVVVKLTAQDEALLTGVRSLRVQTGPKGRKLPGFSLERLFEMLGISAESTSPRSYTAPRAELPVGEAPLQTQRTAPQQPPDDEWSTPQPPARASDEAVRQLNIRLKGKFGPLSDTERIDKVRGFIRRPIASTSEVFEHECAAMLKSLAGLPPYQPPKPEPAPAPVPLSIQQTEDPATIAAAQSLLPLMEADEADRVESSLRDLLESAGDPDELAKAWSTVETRQGEQAIGAVHVMALRQVHELRKASLWAEAQRARQAVAA